MSVQERDPCPHRIFDDIGGAFAMGAIGGGVWNHCAPNDVSKKLSLIHI